MKKADMNNALEKAMVDFKDAYNHLLTTIDHYEQDTKTSVNDLNGFAESYPFDKSLDELAIVSWVDSVVEGLQPHNFKALNYEYLNTGGNTMVGIHEVWLPEEFKTVYVYTNEEGCTITLVDYLRNELDADDYDEFILDYCDFGTLTDHAKYFELYRYCLAQYLKDDCKYFGATRNVPFNLLSDELQRQVTADYLEWLEDEGYSGIDTDGYKVVVLPDYEV